MNKLNINAIANFLAKMAEKSESVYWLSSPDLQKIIYISPSYEKVWGRPRQLLYDNPELWITYLHPEDSKNYHPIHELRDQIKLYGEKARYSEEYRIINGDKKIRWIVDRGFPIIDELGKCLGVTGVAVDITEIKENEQLKIEKAEAEEKKALAELLEERLKTEKEKEIREKVMIFSGAIAHEQRTPLATLNIIAHVMKEHMEKLMEGYHLAEGNDLPVQSIPKRILNAFADFGDQINRLTVQMNKSIDHSLKSLTHSNKENFVEEDLELCNINKCMQQIIDQFPYQENEAQLVHWDRVFDFDFLGNRLLFSGLINNLLKNALEQIRKDGKGEIFISSDSDEKYNYLIFKDTAGGAPPDVMEKLFQGYMTTKKDGTGIGLAMCKLTMKNFGGDITADSVYGDYMKFIFAFPKLQFEN